MTACQIGSCGTVSAMQASGSGIQKQQYGFMKTDGDGGRHYPCMPMRTLLLVRHGQMAGLYEYTVHRHLSRLDMKGDAAIMQVRFCMPVNLYVLNGFSLRHCSRPSLTVSGKDKRHARTNSGAHRG